MNNLTSLIQSTHSLETSIHTLLAYLLNQISSSDQIQLRVAAPSLHIAHAHWSHWHENTEVFFQLEGFNAFQTPVEKFNQYAGEVVIMPARTPHKETPHYENQRWSHLVLAPKSEFFYFHLSTGTPQTLKKKQTSAASQISTNNGILLKSLLSEMIRTESTRLRHRLFLAFCELLIDQLISKSSQNITDRSLTLISRSLSNPDLSVNAIAHELGCHPDSLSRSFKKQMNLSFREYLHRQRMLLAESLLPDLRLEVSEIANLCGYRDHSYFSAEFKRYTGVSPTGYRKPYF